MTNVEKVMVWGSTAVVAVTGTALAWMKYVLHTADVFAVVNHPLQPFVLKLHIVSAPFLIFGIGMITMRHIWPHFRSGWKRGRRSGISSALLALPMIGTGYAIQALTNASWLRIIGYVHFVLGMIFAIGALIHYVAIRRRNNQSTLGPGYPAPSTTATPAMPAAPPRAVRRAASRN